MPRAAGMRDYAQGPTWTDGLVPILHRGAKKLFFVASEQRSCVTHTHTHTLSHYGPALGQALGKLVCHHLQT